MGAVQRRYFGTSGVPEMPGNHRFFRKMQFSLQIRLLKWIKLIKYFKINLLKWLLINKKFRINFLFLKTVVFLIILIFLGWQQWVLEMTHCHLLFFLQPISEQHIKDDPLTGLLKSLAKIEFLENPWKCEK